MQMYIFVELRNYFQTWICFHWQIGAVPGKVPVDRQQKPPKIHRVRMKTTTLRSSIVPGKEVSTLPDKADVLSRGRTLSETLEGIIGDLFKTNQELFLIDLSFLFQVIGSMFVTKRTLSNIPNKTRIKINFGSTNQIPRFSLLRSSSVRVVATISCGRRNQR